MQNNYFLTRQSANLMEDLHRQIQKDASLFLLYGESKVGKTALLDEFAKRRLVSAEIHQLDFSQNKILKHSAVVSKRVKKDVNIIEKVFSAAIEGDVIILDHLEQASNKALQVLFQCWTTDAVDKKLNVVICCDQQFFPALKNFAAPYSLEMQVMPLLALETAEVEAFVSAWERRQSNGLEAAQRKLLQRNIKACGGKIGDIVSTLQTASLGLTSASAVSVSPDSA